MSLCPRALCLVLFLSLIGCSGTIHPPAHPPDPVTVYVTDYGRHSSILLPDPHGNYTEWAFGDWNWFALGHTKWYDALGCIFISPQSTLARRTVTTQPTMQALANELGAHTLLQFDVSHQQSDQLNDHLNRRYQKHITTQLYSTYSQMCHVKDSEIYSGLNNCNDFTAHWLRALGCEVDGFTMLSKFKLGETKR